MSYVSVLTNDKYQYILPLLGMVLGLVLAQKKLQAWYLNQVISSNT